jgi:uncharacterized membrane protein
MVDDQEKEEDNNKNDQEKGPGSKAKRRNMAIVIGVVAILLVASIGILYLNNKPEIKGTQSSSVLQVTNVNMTAVSIPLSAISQTAVWYEYNVSGSTVRFFVVQDSNGVIHAAFDECWMCFNAHLGYRQNGSSMIENCCNMPFPIDQLTAAGCSGDGCHPIFLPSQEVGDQLVFSKSDLAAQRFIFLTKDETANVIAYDSTHVAIPLSLVGQNATWYRYDVSGTLVRFFAVKDSNGTVHTAFDECVKCYKKHLGYRQGADGTMVENCCNMAFSVANITASGCSGMMCHPQYLANEVIGDQVVIAITDLQSGVNLFS